MKRGALLIVALLLICAPPLSHTRTERSAAAKAEFKRQQPCPANGRSTGPCGGYVIDHIRPLCAGGADTAANMQWQTVVEAKSKDRLEIAECRTLRR